EVRLEAARVAANADAAFGPAPDLLKDRDPGVRAAVAAVLAARGGLTAGTPGGGPARGRPVVPPPPGKAPQDRKEWGRLALRLRDAGPAARETILQAFADEYSTGAVRTLADVQPALADVEARRGTVEALARNYIDRKPYAGTWWGTQPAGQKPPARSV